MGKYLVKDLINSFQYIPLFLGLWIFVLLILLCLNKKKIKQGEQKIRVYETASLLAYLGIMIMLTFWSRESGSVTKIDLHIGSSLKINNRNDAMFMENVLLFIPYGFFVGWYKRWKYCLWRGGVVGCITSLMIEVLQLLTGRGVFQIDDIITNTLGCIIGVFFYIGIKSIKRK